MEKPEPVSLVKDQEPVTCDPANLRDMKHSHLASLERGWPDRRYMRDPLATGRGLGASFNTKARI